MDFSSVKAALLSLMICDLLWISCIEAKRWRLTEEEDAKLETQLKILNKPYLKSFKVANGDIIDCVDIYKQPAFDHPLLKNHTLQLRPSSAVKNAVSGPSGKGKHELGVKESCPEGYVPIRRTRKEDLRRAKSMLNTFNSKDQIMYSQTAYAIFGWFGDSLRFYGAEALMDVYNLPDGYQKTGCNNQLCPGYVQVSQKFFPGNILQPGRGAIRLRVLRDPSNLNWYVLTSDETVGYFPKEIFNNMADSNQIEMGGIVHTPPSELSSPPMGNGAYPDRWRSACEFKQIGFFDGSVNSHPPTTTAYHYHDAPSLLLPPPSDVRAGCDKPPARQASARLHPSTSDVAARCDAPPVRQVSASLLPPASVAAAGSDEGSARTRDHAFPLTPEEIQRVKATCGIVDQGVGSSCPREGARARGANATSAALMTQPNAPLSSLLFGTASATCGTRGGLLSAWNPALFDCIHDWAGLYSLNVVLRRKADGKLFTVSNIYGPTDTTLKAGFFQELRSIRELSVGVWTALGDFNVLLSVADKNGLPSSAGDILSFREVVNEIGWIDLPISNKAFTWTNGRGIPTLERLDRAFVSSDWVLFFPRSTLRALPRPRSDHSPLLLSAYTFIPSPNLFRFETFWLRYPAIVDVVSNSWSSTVVVTDPVTRFSSKIKGIQSALQSWSAGFSSAIRDQANLCLRWIEWLDRAEEVRVLSVLERNLRPKLKARYEELCLQDEIKWKQRSRVQWLQAGDANTKFFHMKATGRRNRNYIARLSDGSSTLSSPEPIANHLYSFFSNQLGVERAFTDSINLLMIYNDDRFDLSSLHSPFTLDEVKRTVFSCAPEKAPGPDGLPMIFYQRFWNLIKVDILEVFSCFHNGAANLQDINTSWVCLLPKRNEASLITDFRPISLVHSLSKIISKVLATRLQAFMDRLINPFQAAFIKSRLILDNFNSAHILIHHLHSSKERAAVLKIDFERAFDHINWQFLFEVLKARGFGNRWIGWIKALLQSSNSAVLLNGVPGKAFPCKRGLRQGDPLSLLLFILCVDVLFRMLDLAVTAHSISAVGIGNVQLHTLQFADDLMLFFDGSTRSAAAIKIIVDSFSSNSGLKINFDKSYLIPINLPSDQATIVASYFGCTLKDFPLNYLGLPLSPKKLGKADYMPLIEKIDNRLAGWKGLMLSRGGRFFDH
uniref:Uncharacterized protein n=1 Tax=Ananas comosus var. bracteatus TaxID=296719 RepID=A0A6V7PU29_ANACO|nr:unnamed protein product [Ananas comosus var. bracteatus]